MKVQEQAQPQSPSATIPSGYSALLRRAGLANFVTGPDGRFVEAGDAFAAMLGWASAADVQGLHPQTDVSLHAEDWQEAVAHVPTGEFSDWKVMRWKRRDGNTIAVRVAFRSRSDETGAPWLEGIAEDVSDRERRDELLRRAERMASIGTTLAGVAHELNNPLAAIIGFSQLLLKRPLAAEDRVALEAINHEAMRSAGIVRNLLAMVRRRSGDRRVPTNVNDVVGYILRTRRYALETAGIACRLDLDPALPLVFGDLAQLEQVLLNLLQNAEQALLPELNERPGAPAWISVRTYREDTNVVIEVEDNGPGISEEHAARIWDPFWTTKDEGEGTGLGLSVAHSIVAEHGGSIVLERPDEGGARFRIRIPVAESAPRTAIFDHAVRPLDVLVVDPLVEDAEFVERFLSSRGHAVVRATSADAAVTLATHGAFDVILCDARLQTLDGRSAPAALFATAGGARARFVVAVRAGTAADPTAPRDDDTPPIRFATRPFDVEQLRRLIEGD